MPRPFFACVRHPAVIAELLPYLSGYKWFFHDAAEQIEFAHTLERPGQRGCWHRVSHRLKCRSSPRVGCSVRWLSIYGGPSQNRSDKSAERNGTDDSDLHCRTISDFSPKGFCKENLRDLSVSVIWVGVECARMPQNKAGVEPRNIPERNRRRHVVWF